MAFLKKKKKCHIVNFFPLFSCENRAKLHIYLQNKNAQQEPIQPEVTFWFKKTKDQQIFQNLRRTK